MMRYLLGLLISIIALTFLRAVMGLLTKGVAEAVRSSVDESSDTGDAQASGRRSGDVPKQGQLRRCASCGTYMPEQSMTRYGSGDKSVFFCSAACEATATRS